MNIKDLHHILHPKLGAYIGPKNVYSHSLSSEINLVIEKSASGVWQLFMYERGILLENLQFQSESAACNYLLKFVENI